MTTTVKVMKGGYDCELHARDLSDVVALGTDQEYFYLTPNEAEEIGRALVSIAAMVRKRRKVRS